MEKKYGNTKKEMIQILDVDVPNDEVSVANYVGNSFLNYISWLARNAARVNETFSKVCHGHEETIAP